MRLCVRIAPRVFRFINPAGTSRGVYTERRTWYVVITSPDAPGKWGVGECAPLFDLSCDYGPDYEVRLKAAARRMEITGRLDVEALRNMPSVLFGFETAVRSFQSSLSGDSPLHLFNSAFTRGEASIKTNGLVWMGTFDEMKQRIEEKLEQGFSCVKLKIGAIDFDSEISLIRKIRDRYSPSTIELRVDANGAFSFGEARRNLDELAKFSIHSIEQPIRAGQWEKMGELCRATPIPIALDEELIGVNDVERKKTLLDEIHPQYIILKPSLHGGMIGAEEWMVEARKRNVGYWVTSALETNVGLNSIAQWTAVMHEKFCPEDAFYSALLPQGFGTGHLFVSNFNRTSLSLEGERMWAMPQTERNFRRQLKEFEKEWDSPTPCMTVHTSGSTGKPKLMEVEKKRMEASAKTTCSFLHLQPGDRALLCLPLDYIAGKMMAVRAFVCGLRLFPVVPSARPLRNFGFSPDFVAMTPMQVFETIKHPAERALLRGVKHLIIGGGAIGESLEEQLKDFPNNVWGTYGMTETLSHIALRKINGSDRTAAYFPLPGVRVSLSPDSRLVISAPHVHKGELLTNDLARLNPDGSFVITGRVDNVISSGGIKLQLEELEKRLSLPEFKFCLTAVPDDKFGNALTLLFEAPITEKEAKDCCIASLSNIERPKHYIEVEAIPLTENGKIARKAAAELAARMV